MVSVGEEARGGSLLTPEAAREFCAARGCYDFSIGPGWAKRLLPEIIAAIENDEAAGRPVRVLQVKEKFGQLRFYVGGVSDRTQDLINRLEDASLRTCVDCGEEGRRPSAMRVYPRALCKKCETLQALGGGWRWR